MLSLQFPFPACGDTARDDLYIFLGAAFDTFTAENMQHVQDILDRYLDLMPVISAPVRAPAVAQAPAPAPAPAPPVPAPPVALSHVAVPPPPAVSAAPSRAQDYAISPSRVPAGENPTVTPPAALPQPGNAHEIARYTSLLKEMGDVEGIVPQHTEVMLQETPPIWKATAKYKQWVGEAQGKSKKEARHRASKEVYSMVAGSR